MHNCKEKKSYVVRLKKTLKKFFNNCIKKYAAGSINEALRTAQLVSEIYWPATIIRISEPTCIWFLPRMHTLMMSVHLEIRRGCLVAPLSTRL